MIITCFRSGRVMAVGEHLEQSFKETFGDDVELSRFKSYRYSPYKAAFILFHPVLLLKYGVRWALAQPMQVLGRVAMCSIACFFLSPLALLFWPVVVGVLFKWMSVSQHRGPLIISPRHQKDANAEFLAKFALTHRQDCKKAVDAFGSVLFRGFGLSEVDEFEAVLGSFKLAPTSFFGQAPRKQEAGWKYVFRNLAFESGKRSLLLEPLKKLLGTVWSWEPMFLNYHNEMAYLSPENHLGKYGVFCCKQPPECGGYTLFSDARNVHKRLRRALGDNLPTSMKWVLTRKKHSDVPKKNTGSYVDFLLGEFELSGVDDQWKPNGSKQHMLDLCNKLDLEVETTEDDVAIWSKWISPSRVVEGTNDVTWWCNCNHVQVGSGVQGAELARKLPWIFRFANGEERSATESEVFAISHAYWMESVFFTWQKGDLVIFDNQTVAHGASPGRGKRMIMPSFGSCFN